MKRIVLCSVEVVVNTPVVKVCNQPLEQCYHLIRWAEDCTEKNTTFLTTRHLRIKLIQNIRLIAY